MKEQIIRILENRATKFESINHSYEAREVKSAIDTIKRLVPPELFVIHDVVLQSEQLCDNPHCEDGIVDRDMYGHPIYCKVCDKHN